MADKPQLSAEEIVSEIDSLRQQMRSFALQRAEGLIDANLQRELVRDLQTRVDELENLQTHTNGATTNSDNLAEEQQVIGELLEADTVEQTDIAVNDYVDEISENEMTSDELEQQADEPESISAVDESTSDDVQTVQGMPPIESTESEAESAGDKSDDEESTYDDLVIEEDSSPFRERNDDSKAIGKLVDDVVVSSAMVKEPDYLDEIEPSHDSIHEPNVVDIRDITKTYQMGTFELEVLKGITLQVQKGEFISIMGPSGSGKSTLMNILGALDKPTDGEYFLDAVDVSQMNEKQLAEIRNKKIGFVFQNFNLLKRTSALRQVELPLLYGTATNRTELAREALESVGLGQRLDHTPAELSGGQQQRVAIARALVTQPAIILADEPTGNLDSRSGIEVMEIFQNLNRKNNITTIFVTHDPWIARHTNRVIMLRDGKIIADQRVKNPLVAGQSERPSEAEELQEIFEDTYYGGDEDEYN